MRIPATHLRILRMAMVRATCLCAMPGTGQAQAASGVTMRFAFPPEGGPAASVNMAGQEFVRVLKVRTGRRPGNSRPARLGQHLTMGEPAFDANAVSLSEGARPGSERRPSIGQYL